MEQSELHTVEHWNNKEAFDKECNKFLKEGFDLKCCNTGMAFTSDGGSCDTVYQAVFLRELKQ